MKKLLIAAGGGGDAFTAFALSKCLINNECIIASFSWDRIMYDPTPGPRNASDFYYYKQCGHYNAQISSDSYLKKEGAKSFLPLISDYFGKSIYLLELYGGIKRLHLQIIEIVKLERIDEIIIVDVGGDILAEGHEPGLKSPLADASVLAACKNIPIPISVWVAGCSLDGELSKEELTILLDKLCINSTQHISKTQAKQYLDAFIWLPSEASALFFLSASGKKGVCEIRQDGFVVELSDFSSTIYCLDYSCVYMNSIIAKAVFNSSSLEETELIVKNITSVSELEIERKKQAKTDTWNNNRSNEELAQELITIGHKKSTEGIDYLTTRRVCEILKLKGSSRTDFLQYLNKFYGDYFISPLWICE